MLGFKLSKPSVTDSQISILTFVQDIPFYILIGTADPGRLISSLAVHFGARDAPKGHGVL
jgi:hypothetical protein